MHAMKMSLHVLPAGGEDRILRTLAHRAGVLALVLDEEDMVLHVVARDAFRKEDLLRAIEGDGDRLEA